MVWIVGCSANEHEAVEQVLNQRSQAMHEKNIQDYAALIANDYIALGRDKKKVVDDVQHLFQTFDKIQMVTHDRTVRVLPHGHAECEQSYTLKAYADGQWRVMTRREQLMLQKKGGVWKVTAGL
ncbi:MAG: nuclear transport factor 2 family protein [Mariprofundaceae bacterium]|nr:nuclear transport factor 2 family protein [Mariprofundaceae bacterium]